MRELKKLMLIYWLKKLRQRNKVDKCGIYGEGAENLVGLEMAKVLEGIEVIVLPSDGDSGLNPLNLEATRVLFD